SSTFWRGDGVWATPAGGGSVTHTAGALTVDFPVFGNTAADVKIGGKQGNTNTVVSYAGPAPSLNDCAKFDVNGNLTTVGAACGAGGGAPTIKSAGTTVGSETVIDFLPGGGTVTPTILDVPGTKITIALDVNTAVIQSLTNAQSGGPLLCAPASANGAAYTCAMSPTLTTAALIAGAVINFKPDIN